MAVLTCEQCHQKREGRRDPKDKRFYCSECWKAYDDAAAAAPGSAGATAAEKPKATAAAAAATTASSRNVGGHAAAHYDAGGGSSATSSKLPSHPGTAMLKKMLSSSPMLIGMRQCERNRSSGQRLWELDAADLAVPAPLAQCRLSGAPFPAFTLPSETDAHRLSPRGATGTNRYQRLDAAGGADDDGEDDGHYHQGGGGRRRGHRSLAEQIAVTVDDIVAQVYCHFDEDLTKVILNELDRVSIAETKEQLNRAMILAADTLLSALGPKHSTLISDMVERGKAVFMRLLEEFCGDDAEGEGAATAAGPGGAAADPQAPQPHYGPSVRFVKTKQQLQEDKLTGVSSQEQWLKHMRKRYRQLCGESELAAILKKDFQLAGCALPANATMTQHEGHVRFHVPAPVPVLLPQTSRILITHEMPAWTHAAFGPKVTHLNTIQTKVFECAFHSSKNMLICAPTGAGKTMIALLVMLRQIQEQMGAGNKLDPDFKMVFVAPMKALAAEMTANFSQRLACFNLKVREFTGDMQLTKREIAETTLIVTTPEKWDVVTRKQVDNELAAKAKVIIIDEIHLLNDDRGPVLEAIVARSLRRQDMLLGGGGSGDDSVGGCRLVGLSATLPNYKDVANFLRVNLDEGLFVFGPEYRPVPLEQSFVGTTAPVTMESKKIGSKPTTGKAHHQHSQGGTKPAHRETDAQQLDRLAWDEVVRHVSEGHQVMVFVHARKQTVQLATFFAEQMRYRKKEQLFEDPDPTTHSKKKGQSLQGKDLSSLFQSGLGVHHAGLIRYDRSTTEDLFRQGNIRVLVCTSTLAWGVNLPAHTVIIRGTQIYDPKHGGFVSMSVLDVMQIFGRAGRPQYDTSGHGVIISDHSQVANYLRLIAHALPIESKLQTKLCDHLNAEVHAGTVSSVAEGVQWLEYTYLWQRIRANPLAYGLRITDVRHDPELRMARSNIIASAAKQLNEAGMVRYNMETGSLDTTDLGRVASHFYVENVSISTFNDLMRKADGTLADAVDFGTALNVSASANEFSQLRARQDELDELNNIHQRLPASMRKIRIAGESTDETSIQWKVTTLLKAYFGRIVVDAHSLTADMNYIIQNAGRIARALFEIELMRGHPFSTATFLTVGKCIERRCFEKDHPLMQFNGCEDIITDAVWNHLNTKRPSMSMLAEMSEKEIGDLVHNHRVGGIISQLVRSFPNIDVQAEIQPITRTVLRIKATIKANFVWNDRYHGGAESFWLFIEDQNNNLIFHHEQVILKKKDVKNETPVTVNVTVPIFPEYDTYCIRVYSDRWLGSVEEYTFSLGHLHLPDDVPPNTKLLPLTPLRRNVIPPRYHKIYEHYPQLNAVQSQVFHCMFHTDANALLGAPTGSGKTIAAEMAMLRVLERNAAILEDLRRHNAAGPQQPQSSTAVSGGGAASPPATSSSSFPSPPSSPFVPPKASVLTDAAQRLGKIIFIAPLKALVKERMKDWKERFQNQLGIEVVELSGDVTPDIQALSRAQILCTTPEKWDGISRNWQVRSYVGAAQLVIFDEIHMLGSDRGPVLEVIVSRMRYIGWHRGVAIRLVGLSTAVANPGDLGAWLGVDKPWALFNFDPSVRPVPMRCFIAGYPGKHYCPRMQTMNKPTYNAIVEKSPAKPVIVFVSSRRQTRLTAMALINFLIVENNTAKFVRMTLDEVQEQVAQLSDPHLKHCTQFGIGMHHAGLGEGDKAVMENLFRRGKLQILVATSTLAWGVNFPAHLVVVKGTEYYDGKTKSYVDYPITDILQMIGRAGRPQYDTEGVAQVLCHEPKKSFFRKFLYDPFPVESALHQQLHEHINAEIVAGTISSRQDAVDYLTWTYLFRRLIKNPSYYGVEDSTPRALTAFLSQIVNKILTDLETANCIEPPEDEHQRDDDGNLGDPNRLVCTVLGKLCSYYYLKPATAYRFDTEILSDMTHVQLLKLMCEADEFEQLPVRHNEDQMNIELAGRCPIPVDLRNAESPHVKANLLFQAHMERAKLPISDYFTDQRSAIDNSVRIIQAMVDIAANNGHLFSALRTMSLLPCLVQARWWSDHTLLQLPHVTEELIAALREDGAGDPSSHEQEHTGDADKTRRQKGGAAAPSGGPRRRPHRCVTHIAHLANATSATFDHFMSVAQRARFGLSEGELEELSFAARHLPLIDVQLSLTRRGDSEVVVANAKAEGGGEEFVIRFELNVELTRLSAPTKHVVAPKFAKGKDEQYWVCVGHEPTGELVAVKRVNRLHKRSSVTLNFDWDDAWATPASREADVAADGGVPRRRRGGGDDNEHVGRTVPRNDAVLQVYLIGDSHIGLDQQYGVLVTGPSQH